MDIKNILRKEIPVRYGFYAMVIFFLIFVSPCFLLFSSHFESFWFVWSWGCACAFVGAAVVIWYFRNKFDKW